MSRPSRPRCGGSQGQEQRLPAAPRRSLVTQNQAAALRRLFTLSALLPAALLHPPPELRGVLLLLHRVADRFSFSAKSPLEPPPSKIPFFPPLWALLSVSALASWVPRSPRTRHQGPSRRPSAGCTASASGMVTLGYLIFRGTGVAFSFHIFTSEFFFLILGGIF